MARIKGQVVVSQEKFVAAYIAAQSLEDLVKATGLNQKQIDAKIANMRNRRVPIMTLKERGWVESKRSSVEKLKKMLEGTNLIAKLAPEAEEVVEKTDEVIGEVAEEVVEKVEEAA
jgi:hypothetical protein